MCFDHKLFGGQALTRSRARLFDRDSIFSSAVVEFIKRPVLEPRELVTDRRPRHTQTCFSGVPIASLPLCPTTARGYGPVRINNDAIVIHPDVQLPPLSTRLRALVPMDVPLERGERQPWGGSNAVCKQQAWQSRNPVFSWARVFSVVNSVAYGGSRGWSSGILPVIGLPRPDVMPQALSDSTRALGSGSAFANGRERNF